MTALSNISFKQISSKLAGRRFSPDSPGAAVPFWIWSSWLTIVVVVSLFVPLLDSVYQGD
jgi:hypothetical protein